MDQATHPAAGEWTPELVDQLLYRQFGKGDDVSAMLPPTVSLPTSGLGLGDSLKAMYRWAERGPGGSSMSTPATPISSRSIAAPRTPGAVKKATALGARTPTNTKQQQPVAQPPAPVHYDPSGDAENVAPPQQDGLVPSPKKAAHNMLGSRIERRVPWPNNVPVNEQLVSKSRSAVQHLTQSRLRAQEHVDPDWIFAQPDSELPLASIFRAFPESQDVIRALRGLSGDWRNDSFTEREELLYKEAMMFQPGAPSQVDAARRMTKATLLRVGRPPQPGPIGGLATKSAAPPTSSSSVPIPAAASMAKAY